MTAILEKVDGATLGTRSIGLGIITMTEETLGIRLLQGLGRGNAIRILVGMSTLTATENPTETKETTETALEITTTTTT